MINIKKRYCAILSILSLLYSLFLLVTPILMKNLVDVALSVSDGIKAIKDLYYIIIALGAIILVDIVIFFIQRALYFHFSVKLENEFKNDIFSKFLHKDYNGMLNYHTAELEQLFNTDIINIINTNLDTIPNFIKQLTRLILAIIIVIIMDYRFLIFILVCAIIGFIFSKLYSSLLQKRHKEVLEAKGVVNSYIVEAKDAFKLLKTYKSEAGAERHFTNLCNCEVESKRKRNKVLLIASTGLFCFSNLAYLFVLGYGAVQIAFQALSYGSILALVQLFNHIQAPILTFSQLLNQYNLGKTSNLRINKLLNLEDDNCDIKLTSFDEIIFKDVCFSYPNHEILKDFNYKIYPNQIIHLQGPSGIGKTTLFMLLLGFLKPTSGEIIIKKDGNNYTPGGITRSLFAYVAQENILFSGTILDNIKILTGSTDDEIIAALKTSNVYDELMNLPLGLNTILKKNGVGLSLGQIQRILIAVAILSNRPILLLDEFSSALDIENEMKIVENLIRLNKTIIYITHRKNLIKNDDTIILKELNNE